MNKIYSCSHTIKSDCKNWFLRVCLLLLFSFQTAIIAYAQCNNSNASGSITAPLPGNTTQINACAFAGDYSTINGVTALTSYTVTSSIATDYLTVRQGTPGGTVIAFGATPLTWTSEVSGTYYVHVNSNYICNTQATCRNTAITNNGSCSPPVITVTPNNTCGGFCFPITASGADSYNWFPFAGLYTNCTQTIPYTGGNSSIVYADPLLNTTYMVTGKINATGCTGTATAAVNGTPPVPIVTPPAVFMCLGDPAVKLKVVRSTNTDQFCSGSVSINVPDNNPTGGSSSIAVSGIPANINITGISVTISMLHTRVGDMVFVLRGPNGQVINLDYYLNSTGGNGPTTGFVNTVISSTGTAALSSGSNAYGGIYRPDYAGPTGVLGPGGPTGMLPTAINWASLYSIYNGSWTLGFYDGVTGEVGTLFSWCLNITYSTGNFIPTTTKAVWSPGAGLFSDPASTIPYIIGTAVDSVWTRPIPAGVYQYQVTTQGLPPVMCSPATNFINTDGNATVTINIRNNHPYPIRLLQIDSRTSLPGLTFVSGYYKTAAINGAPGAISGANGWIPFGGANITGTGTGIQPFMTALSLIIPAGATYGICLQAITAAFVPNLAYSTISPGTHSFDDGGCEIITGTNIGYSGDIIPVAPVTTLSGFVGKLYFSKTTPVCTSLPRTVVVTVGLVTTITTPPVNQNICLGQSAVFSVTAAGSAGLTYQWRVSSNGGSTYTNIVNAAPYSGVNTATLTINTPPLSMSGSLYRVSINGAAACAGVVSPSALLTINPLPTVTITANPLIIGPTQTTTIFSTVTPNPATTYTWYYNNSVLPGATLASLLVNYGSPGDYQLKVTDINNCGVGVSNIITIANSFALNTYTYPNPNAGIFQVRYPSEVNIPTQRALNVFNNRGEKIITRNFTQTIPYQKIDVDVRSHGKGLYWIELRDATGKRLAINRAVVQ